MSEPWWTGCAPLEVGNLITSGNLFNFSPNWGEFPFIIGIAYFSVVGIIMLIHIATDMVRPKPKFSGDGVLTLADTPTALKFEKLIKAAGYQVKLVAPPPDVVQHIQHEYDLWLEKFKNSETSDIQS